MESFELLDKWFVRSTRRLISMTESLICQAGARPSIAEAEGFSILNQRSAALLSQDIPDLSLPATSSTLVCHRERHLSDALELKMPFELQAASAQEAVYHCLIAHDIAAKLNIPGLCSVDDTLAQRLEGARMPTREMIDMITPIGQTSFPNFIDENAIISIIRNSFERFNPLFSIDLNIFEAESMQDDGICFVTTGRYREHADILCKKLNEIGISAGYLVLKLIKPFPEHEITGLLHNQKHIIVLGEDDISEQSFILSGLHEIQTSFSVSWQLLYIPMHKESRFEKLASILNIAPGDLESAFDNDSVSSGFVIGAAPGGQMSRGLLFDLAAELSKMNGYSAFPTKSTHPLINSIGIEKTRSKHQGTEKRLIDLLFLSHPGLIDIQDILNDVAPHGIILVLGRSVEEASIWPLFSFDMKNTIEKKDISVYFLPGSLLNEYQMIDKYGSYVVHGALLGLFAKRAQENLDFQALPKNRILSGEAFNRLMIGSTSFSEVDRSVKQSDRFDPYFAPQINLPRMLPSVRNRTNSADWRSSVRNFFVRGQSTDAHHHPLPGLSIRPAALNPYLESLEREHFYPLIVTRITGNPKLQTQRLDETLRSKFGDLSDRPQAAQSLTQYIACAEKIADASLHITPAKTLLNEALESVHRLYPDFDTFIFSGIREFIAGLDSECHLVGLNPHTLLDLYVLSVRAARRSRMHDVGAEIRTLVTQLREKLRVDDAYGPFGMSESVLKDAFGPDATEFLDTNEIAHDLQHRHCGHKQHDPERLTRMFDTLKTLESFLKSIESSDDLIFTYPPEIQVKTTYDRVRTVCHNEPIAVANGLFDAISQKHIEAFKAMRIARLDIDNAFDPNYHGDILEHFTWQDLSEDELRLLPVICIAETTAHLYAQLSPLSRLIRAGKPLDVLVFESTSKAMSTDPVTSQPSYDPGFSYLATAFREAFVAQSTLARPDHLVANLARMNQYLRPAITVVACPTWSWRLPARVQLEAAHYGRTAPMFQYTPNIDKYHSERFNINGNPQPDLIWPTCSFSYIDEDGNIRQMEGTFTFAHALALEPGYHKYFRILPNEAWNDELIEIGEFLKNPSFDKPQIPYIWGVVDSQLRKCIMTRDVANACIDRMQRWKALKELSRVTPVQSNALSQHAFDDVSEKLEASRQAFSDVSEKLETSQNVLRNTANVLTQCLREIHIQIEKSPEESYDLNEAMREESAYIEGLAEDYKDTPQETSKQETTAAPQDTPPVAEQPQQPALPYIETNRCLSCGACVGINDKIFGFNENEQAILIKQDATCDECREAAETCPVECIHVS